MRSSSHRCPTWVTAAIASTFILVTTVLVSAHLSGPPPGYTGAPGEEGCDAAGCHTPPATSPVLGFTIATPPVGLDTVKVSVSLALDQSQGSLPLGFQATVLDTAGRPVGELLLLEPTRTQLVAGSAGRTYVSHTQAGVVGGICINCERWTFLWVRPDTPLAWAIVYSAGCWGNGDGTASGDEARTKTQGIGPVGSCVVTFTGDVNLSGTVTSADIISVVHYVFKGGASPLPCVAAGDADCTGTITAADIIRLVNYLFKGGQPPCDVCDLIPDPWSC